MMFSSYWVDQPDPTDVVHYGVKGMKWGVRRYENKDGTLTALGKKRQALDNERKKSKNSAASRFAKREFEDEKIRSVMSKNGYKKTKRQLRAEQRYMDQGFTKEEAEIRAARNRRTARRVAAVAGVAAVALGARAAYKHYDRITDRVLSKDSVLGRMTVDSMEDPNRAFYAFNNAKDKRKYTGLYGKTLYDNHGEVFRKNMSVKQNIKIASDRTAQRVAASLIKNDSEFRDGMKDQLRTRVMFKIGTPAQQKLYKRAIQDMNEGNYDTKSMYDAFNSMLVDHSPTGESRNAKFYSALKNAGYGAIRDANDKRHSGYGAKDPLIVFDTAKVAVNKVSSVPLHEINKNYNAEVAKIFLKPIAKAGAVAVAGGVGINRLGKATRRKAEDALVRRYRQEHPNTEMTRNEILRSLRH